MKKFANFALFQAGWFACLVTAARGHMWLGPIAVAAIIALHLRYITERGERRAELIYILAVGALGALLDSVLGAIGATSYPTSEAAWGLAIVPPWITALWLLFATLPHHSMAWLRRRPLLSVVAGAVGGPLSYLAGSHFDAVGMSETPMLTWAALAVEYAIVMPLLMSLARDVD